MRPSIAPKPAIAAFRADRKECGSLYGWTIRKPQLRFRLFDVQPIYVTHI